MADEEIIEPEVTEEVTEEAVEAVEGDDAVDLGAEPEGAAVEATDEPVDPFAEFGGREAAQRAHEMYTRASTEDGVVQLFLEAGRSLGLGLKEMEQLFGQQASDAPPAEEEDPDRLLTFREFQEMQNKDKAEI